MRRNPRSQENNYQYNAHNRSTNMAEQLQAALLTLTNLRYLGSPVGSNFNIRIESFGEITDLNVSISLGQSKTFNEYIVAKQVPPPAPFHMPLSITVDGTAPELPAHGTLTPVAVVLPSPPSQTFIYTVAVNGPFGSGSFEFTFIGARREWPVSYDPEWLCRNRYNWSAFHRWLCLGDTQVPGFLTLSPIVSLKTHMQSFQPALAKLDTRLSLGYSPAGSSLFQLTDYTFDVAMAAAAKITTVELRWGYVLSDFATPVDVYIGDFIGIAVPIISPTTWTVCNKWRDLLDCFCRFCSLRQTYAFSPTILNYYDTVVAPIVDRAYPAFVTVAQSISLDYYLDPFLVQQCDKLRGLVSFWAWWCRICNYVVPPWELTVEPYYNDLFYAHREFSFLLEAESILICREPEEDFCDRWENIWDCVSRLCDLRSGFLPGVITDMEATFGPIVRNMYTLLRYPSVPAPPTGINNTCSFITWLKKYFSTICPDKAIPGGLSRRAQLDSYLLQFETALTGFKSRNGDLCADIAQIDGCDEWEELLDCLTLVCSKLSTLPTGTVNAFMAQMRTSIDGLYWFLNGWRWGPMSLISGSLCGRIADIRRVILEDLCPDTYVTAAYKATMFYWRNQVKNALNTLKLSYPDICKDAFCEEWLGILECLSKICDRHEEISANPGTSGTTTYLVSNVKPVVNGVYNAVFLTTPAPGIDVLCASLHELMKWFIDHCICVDDIPQTLRNQLEYVWLPQMRTKYLGLQSCPCDCLTTNLEITTGKVPWTVTATVTGVPVPAEAKIVTGTNGIAAPITSSDWISPLPTAMSRNVGWTTFQRCFCLCKDASVRVLIEYWADDYAEVYLDGVLLSAPVQANMTHTVLYNQVRSLLKGRHCLEIKVRNQPAVNMALNARGYLEDLTGNLLKYDCCPSTFVAPTSNLLSDICCGLAVDCDRLAVLPRYMDLFCAGTSMPQLSDPDVSTLSGLLPGYVGTLSPIVTALGVSISAPSSNFCSRMDYVLRVMVMAASNPWVLTTGHRYQLECMFGKIQSHGALYAARRTDAPATCDTCHELVNKWLTMLNCICRLCANRTLLTQNNLADDFDAIICDDITSLYTYVSGIGSAVGAIMYPNATPGDCCDRIRRIVTFFGQVSLNCETLNDTVIQELETRYNTLHAEYKRLLAVLAPADLDICDDFCDTWKTMLECVMQLCFRSDELPQSIKTLMLTLDTPTATLYQTLTGSSAGISPFTADVFGNLCWNVLRSLGRFQALCTPFTSWNAGVRSSVIALLPAYTTLYNTLKQSVDAAGIHICEDAPDHCGALANIPGYYSLFCLTTPPTPTAPVTALETLLTQFIPDLAALQRSLNLSVIAYPSGSSFCIRLGSTLQYIAIAYSRIEQVPAWLRTRVEFFYSVFASQSRKLKTLLGSNLPASSTIGRLRNSAFELLRCLCNYCERRASLPAGAVTALETEVGPEIALLYTQVLQYATDFGLPFIADPCPDAVTTSARNRCRQLRIIFSFFSMFSLPYGEAPNGTYATAITVLADRLRKLGKSMAGFKGQLASSNVPGCNDEDMRSVAIQSPYLYLQAAGSDASDGSSAGVHLRWQFLQQLQEHLPKGNLAAAGSTYAASYGFNRPDDFVKIYRSPYTETFPLTINFGTTAPSKAESTEGGIDWTFDGIKPDALFANKRSVKVRFKNTSSYTTARSGRNPVGNAAISNDIITKYQGVIEVEVVSGPLMFALEVSVAVVTTPNVKIEGLSYPVEARALIPTISCREEFTTAGPHKVFSEMIRRFRFKCQGCYPTILKMEVYEDYYIGAERRFAWERIGEYSLSLNQTEVFNRLEDTSRFTVNNQWPRYNRAPIGTDPNEPGAKVSVANYRDRWDPVTGYRGRDMESGVRYAVEQYLIKSKSSDNPEGSITHGSSDVDDETQVKISTLRMLNFISLDYHIARMLGLGHIDWQVPISGDPSTQRYMYFAEYETLSGTKVPAVIHRFLSLPTARTDYRLPVMPEIQSHTFGLPQFDPSTPKFTDSNGYTTFGDTRFIQFNKKALPIDVILDNSLSEEGFFSGTERYSRGRLSRPVLYGIKHRLSSSSQWTLPEFSNDLGEYAHPSYQPYTDQFGHPEALPLPEKANPIFTLSLDKTRDNGKTYLYGIYGINWFSRVSNVRDYITIPNAFPKRNTLVAPSNLTAHFVQKEFPRLFNTEVEQSDTNLHSKTRVMFDWHHVHNQEYDRATKVKFLFRENPPEAIKGKITSIVDLGGSNHQIDVYTTHYYDYSADQVGGAHIQPVFTGSAVRFKNSFFATNEHRYYVEAVRAEGPDNYAVFTLKQEYARPVASGVEPIRPDIDKKGAWYGPLVDETFMVVENLGTTAVWTKLDQCDMELVNFMNADGLTEYMETETDPSGQTRQLRVGGLTRTVTIEEQFELDGGGTKQPYGLYKITFANDPSGFNPLAPYNKPLVTGVKKVEWYKGVVRIRSHNGTGDWRVLEVMRLSPETNDPLQRAIPLTIWAYDPNYQDQTAAIITRNWTPQSRPVNLHPSYRVYLDLSYNVTTIATKVMPQTGAPIRQTYISAYSADATYESPLTPPAPHIARRMIVAQPPRMPEGNRYATRPDFYGKSSYTFDVMVDRTLRNPQEDPYSMIFYRASQVDILNVLYRPATVDSILAALAALPTPDTLTQFYDRWKGLVNVETDPGNDDAFVTINGYKFPKPNNPAYWEMTVNGMKYYPFDVLGTTLNLWKSNIAGAIMSRALPLTEAPAMFNLIDTDSNLVTSNRTPKIKDANGDPLFSGQAGFDPFPMVKKKAEGSGWRVRFTDFKLDGASKDYYFYFAVEISTSGDVSDPGGVLGPIRLINSYPPVAPDVVRVKSQAVNPLLGHKPMVIFTIAPYLESDDVKKIRIYRTLDPLAALSLQEMKDSMVLEVDIPATGTVEEKHTVRDTFAGMSVIPFGQPLYYRLVAMRKIINEAGAEEFIASKPSELVIANVVDTVNPDAPVLANPTPTMDGSGTITNLVLTWDPTTSNGWYYLYKMSEGGNWVKLKEYEPGDTLVFDWTAERVLNSDLPLLKRTKDGNTMYHRFKVMVKNTSGLMNLEDNVKIV